MSHFQTVCLLVCLFSRSMVSGQVIGLESFGKDSAINGRITALGVKAVAETIREDTITMHGGQLFFDSTGSVVRWLTPIDSGLQKITYSYQNNKLVRIDVYSDTVRLESWRTWTLDTKGRAEKEGYGLMKDGEKVEYIKFDYRSLSEEPGKSHFEIRKYSAGKLESLEVIRDSVARKDTFHVTLEYRSEDRSKGPHGKKIRLNTNRNGKAFTHEITYGINHRPGAVVFLRTSVSRSDKKGRLLELYEVEYPRPDGSPGNSWSNYSGPNSVYTTTMVQAVLAGDSLGNWRILQKNAYDQKGRMIKMQDSEFENVYTYDQQGQMLRWEFKRHAIGNPLLTQTDQDIKSGFYTYAYNARGLLTECKLVYTLNDGSKTTVTRTYSYTFR